LLRRLSCARSRRRRRRLGPDLDQTKPDAALVREVVTNGKGAMPAFDDELTDEQIRSLATFVSTGAGK
jgi:cytochrome c6